MARKKETPEQGEVWVGAAGTYYVSPAIDADTIRDHLGNNYITEQFDRLQSLLFSDYYQIKVYPPRKTSDDMNEERDKDLEERLYVMCESPDVRLWDRIRQAWRDARGWGAAFLNPVWAVENGERVLKKLRRLDPYSFRKPPIREDYLYSQILRGVRKTGEDSVEFWQTQTGDKMVRLSNIWMVKDPKSPEIAGTSDVIPVCGLISMLNFAWQAEIQKANRDGAPIVFAKITNPIKTGKTDQVREVQTHLRNWGKNTTYVHRDNVEFYTLDLKSTDTAEKIISMLENRIRDFFSPATLIKKMGESIGGNNAAEVDMIKLWCKGEHRWIEMDFAKRIIQEWLDTNGYEGYTGEIDIPEPRPDRADFEARQAEVGYATRSLTVNELRQKLGQPPLSEEELTALEEHYAKVNQPQMMGVMGGFGNRPPGLGEQGKPAPEEEEDEASDEDKSTNAEAEVLDQMAGFTTRLERVLERGQRKAMKIAEAEYKKRQGGA